VSEIVKVKQIVDVSLPLSRLTAIHADESAVEAIGDWLWLAEILSAESGIDPSRPKREL
jgi:hypothetical protein